MKPGLSKLDALPLQRGLLEGRQRLRRGGVFHVSGVSLRPQPRYSEALTPKPPALEPSGLVSSIWSPPSGLFQLSSGPWGRFLVLMMPLEIPRGPRPPEGRGASNPLV